jgi:hypothetical protein
MPPIKVWTTYTQRLGMSICGSAPIVSRMFASAGKKEIVTQPVHLKQMEYLVSPWTIQG